ncbi:MAG: hypothetical protein IT380_28805, partial [Myxococcales bacterium]|nr:hypothetical protein [Myxococcales bacterium]
MMVRFWFAFLFPAALAVLLVGCGAPSPSTCAAFCTGCCTASGECLAGTEAAACGSAGALCTACARGQCVLNVCVGPSGGGAGGGAGGGTGGGAGGGGAGGGGA